MILVAKMERNSMAETDIIDDDGLVAAYTFVQSMLGKADGALDRGTSPFFGTAGHCARPFLPAQSGKQHMREGTPMPPIHPAVYLVLPYKHGWAVVRKNASRATKCFRPQEPRQRTAAVRWIRAKYDGKPLVLYVYKPDMSLHVVIGGHLLVTTPDGGRDALALAEPGPPQEVVFSLRQGEKPVIVDDGTRTSSCDRRGQLLPRSARVVTEGRTREKVMHGRRRTKSKE